MADQYYRRHVFFCTNRRDDGESCCAEKGSQALRDYAKQRLKALGMRGKGQIRINNAGCLDRCEEGPVIVVYPEGTWYTYVDQKDIDEIIDSDLIGGKIVERLKI
jgi:(2Fe-2S) ferredoxin